MTSSHDAPTPTPAELDEELLDAIAIVGMACRLPQAPTVAELWSLIEGGREAIRFFTREELLAAGLDPALVDDPDFVPANGSLGDVSGFDAAFFDMSPKVAEITDPQQRLFLEIVWEALERAGYDPSQPPGPIGVWAGESLNGYLLANVGDPRFLGSLGELQSSIGNRTDHLAPMAAYKLDLKGPAITVQTTCSTALVAVHLACQSLLGYQCSLALAGGVRVQVPQETGYRWQEGGIFSEDGHCRPFDAQASGTLNGSGAGVVVLKRLEDALADGDHIHAVIRGSAVNNDGAAKIGYTAPSVDGQAKVIAMAQAVAGVSPDTVGYVEAHGTGTPLGDPIEVSALTRVFRQKTDRKGFCALGSVKANLGHLDTAAGVAGLIKTALALEHRTLPPTPHFEAPNPALDLAESPFRVLTEAREWPAGDAPRRAGVSSFGIGGTNAHLVLEEAPAPTPSGPAREWQMLLLSARTPSALEAATENLERHLAGVAARAEEDPEAGRRELADLAYTLEVGRKAFEHRRAVLCRSPQEAVATFDSLDRKRVFTSLQEPRERRLAFLLPGQGAQHPGMAAELHRTEPVFREAWDRCADLLAASAGLDLSVALDPEGDPAALRQTALAQPALFAVEWSLARLLASWGLEPTALLGHSVGEWVAAALAGVFTLEDALTLVAERGRLVQALPEGGMLSAHLGEADMRRRLETTPLPEGLVAGSGDGAGKGVMGDLLDLAAVNRPGVSVVSGPDEALDAFEATLVEAGIGLQRLHTSHAFHSRMMEPAVEALTEAVAAVERSAPRLPWISNLSGTWITAEEATDPAYWGRHLRQAVRFGAGVETLLADGEWLFLEVGPGTTLSSLVRQHPAKAAGQIILSCLPHPQAAATTGAVETLTTTLARLWIAGVEVDWQAYHQGAKRRRLPLPTYPFERRRHWFEARKAPALEAAGRRSDDPGDWLWAPSWTRSTPAMAAAVPRGAHWLILADHLGVGDELARRLEVSSSEAEGSAQGSVQGSVTTVYRADGAPSGAGEGARVEVDDPAALGKVLEELAAAGRSPQRIVHLWALGEGEPEELARRGYSSLVALAQALGTAGLDGLTLEVVTDGMQEVTGGDLRHPEKALVLGPCRVLPTESESILCRSLDFEAGAGDAPEALVDRLLRELAAADRAQGGEAQADDTQGGDTQADDTAETVAWRGRHRWVQGFEQLSIPEPSRPALRPGGVCLVTGGLGGMGLTFAEHLGTTARARLVLVGRRGLPDRERWDGLEAEGADPRAADSRTMEAIRVIRAIEAAGGEVLTLAADVSDRQALAGVIAETHRRFGPIHGVIHGAGVPPGGLLQLADPQARPAGFGAKVDGTRHLDALLAETQGDERLDFFFVCGSRSVLLAPPGAADYVAANAFEDAWSLVSPSAEGLPHRAPADRRVTVDWCAWRGVGMLVDAAGAGAASGSPRAAREGLGDDEPAPGERVPLEGLAYPLFDRAWLSASGEHIFETVFSPRTHWLLDDHRIGGHAVLVGTSYLELARAALAAQVGDVPYDMRDIFFLSPVRLRDDESRPVRVILSPREDGSYGFHAAHRLVAEDGTVSWEKTVMGVLVPAGSAAYGDDPDANGGEPPTLDLEAILARTTVFPSMAAIEEEMREDLGPRWQTVQQLHRGDGEVLGILDLGDAFAGEVDTLRLHPALLDRAVSLGANYLADDVPDEFFLPMSYDRMRIHGTLPRRIYSWVRRLDRHRPVKEVFSFEVVLTDEHGRVVVEIDRFSRKRVGDAWAQLRSAVAKEGSQEGQAPGAPAGRQAAARAPEAPTASGTDRFAAILDRGVDPAQGVALFERALAAAAAGRLVASPDPLPAAMAEARERRGLAGLAQVDLGETAPRHERPLLDTPFEAPSSDLEKALAGLWSQVLGVEGVGVHDNFFELGGDSVLGVQVIARAKAQGIALAPSQLFELQTVAALARHLESGEGDAPAETVAGAIDEPVAPTEVAASELDKLSALLTKADGP